MSRFRGFGLIEVVVAVGLTTTVVVAVATLMSSTLRAAVQDQGRRVAVGLAEEGIEAAVNLARDRWSAMPVAGTYHPAVDAATGAWSLPSGQETVTLNNVAYVRKVVLSDVRRASQVSGRATGDVVSSGGFVDAGTKRAVVDVTWPNRYGGTSTVTVAENVSRWARRVWAQSSWGGGTGQATWSDPTRYFSNDGNVQLAGTGVQLKATDSTGGVPASGSTSNAGFDVDASGWTYAPWGSGTGSTGAYVSSGGNPGGYARIRIQDRNATAGGYWYQPIVITADAVSAATVSIDWSVIRHDGGTTGMRVYAFVDPTSGAPTLGQQVWSSPVLTAASPWASSSAINVASRITGPGTYYLKIALYGTFGNQGPDVRVGFDNVTMSWTGTTTGVTGTVYPSSGTIESSTYDVGAGAEYGRLSWTQVAPPGTSVSLQIATSADGTSWTFVGPDGTSATEFTDPAGALVHASADGRRYVRYRAYLRTSDVTKTPVLSAIRLDYSP